MTDKWSVRLREKYYAFAEKINWGARGAAGLIGGGGAGYWTYTLGDEYLWPAIIVGGITALPIWKLSGFLDDEPIGRRERIVEEAKYVEYDGKGDYEL